VYVQTFEITLNLFLSADRPDRVCGREIPSYASYPLVLRAVKENGQDHADDLISCQQYHGII
jgi:hypothetical protein